MRFQPGIYRHYKDPLYQGLFLAHDANAGDLYANPYQEDPIPLGERLVVVYVGLQLDAAKEGERMAVRSVKDWNAWVHTKGSPQEFGSECVHFALTQDGNFCHCNAPYSNQHIVRRFTYLGSAFASNMLP